MKLSASEQFEQFVAELLLKDYEVSSDDVQYGLVDGANDGGIDAIYTVLDGEVVTEDYDVSSAKKGSAELKLYLIQTKISGGFQAIALDKMMTFARDTLDLDADLQNLTLELKPEIIRLLECFRRTYSALMTKKCSLEVVCVYATTGDDIHPNVHRKRRELELCIKNMFSACTQSVRLLRGRDIVDLHQQPPKQTKDLKFTAPPLSESSTGYVGLVNLAEFYMFILLPSHEINASLFESNIRDYQGSVSVNRAIAGTLQSDASEDFWWLNNGVTIVATSASSIKRRVVIENPLIVNGLQTSNEIYRHFKERQHVEDDRNVLVRIIVPDTPTSRDKIIRATNNQTPIPAASLRATDAIHRDIETFLQDRGFYYERRKNQYKNQEKPADRIVSMPYLAQAVTAIVRRSPEMARAHPTSLLKKEHDYTQIFSKDYPLDVFLACIQARRTVENFLRASGSAASTGFARDDIRHHLTMFAVYSIAGRTAVKASDLPALNLHQMETSFLDRCFDELVEIFTYQARTQSTSYSDLSRSPEFTELLLERLNLGLAGRMLAHGS